MKQALKKLKQRKAPGPDQIHGEMMKRLGAAKKDILLRLINTSSNSSHHSNSKERQGPQIGQQFQINISFIIYGKRLETIAKKC